jgi:hypothetical protein
MDPGLVFTIQNAVLVFGLFTDSKLRQEPARFPWGEHPIAVPGFPAYFPVINAQQHVTVNLDSSHPYKHMTK